MKKTCLMLIINMICCQFTLSAITTGISAGEKPNIQTTKIALQIDWPVKTDIPWPVTCGVPFPIGMINNTKSLAVVNGKGNMIPCQFDVTAHWLDKSIRWVLLNFKGAPGENYYLKTGYKSRAKPDKTIKISDNANKTIRIDTGKAIFTLNKNSAIPDSAEFMGYKWLEQSGNGPRLIDNQGRTAYMGGPGSDMSSQFLLKGPLATVIRREGWYVTEQNVKVARGIVWLYFYADCPYLKITHKLVLTEDTNDIWFKDISIKFNTPVKGDKCVFAVSDNMPAKTADVDLPNNGSAWMLQDMYPHFMNNKSHFELCSETDSKNRRIILEGEKSGDWCALKGQKVNVALTLDDFAEQFPKEFTITPNTITVHLWSGRSGKELDFRTSTLMKDYWGEWAKKAPVAAHELREIYSNAQASAKTHTMWLLPTDNNVSVNNIAETASGKVLALPSPSWICASDCVWPFLAPVDKATYPKQEMYIYDFFDRLVYADKACPSTGYLAWGKLANPKATAWYRLNGQVDYWTRRLIWHLYARSGDRKYFNAGRRYNRFLGDMAMHNWTYGKNERNYNLDSPLPAKVKGGFTSTGSPKEINLKKYGPIFYPMYWGWSSFSPVASSGADLFNYLYQFYFSGDWEQRELVENYKDAIKNYPFMTPDAAKIRRGDFLALRCLTAVYSMDWDNEIGTKIKELANRLLVPSSPMGVNLRMSPTPTYKLPRNILATLDYYRLTGDPKAKESLMKMINYKYSFNQLPSPLSYQGASGIICAIMYRLTGDKKYLPFIKMALGINHWNESELKDELAKYLSGKTDNKPKGQNICFVYGPFLNMPAAMKIMDSLDEETINKTKSISDFPVMRKFGFHSPHTVIAVRKKDNENLTMELLFKVNQDSNVVPMVYGPSMQPFRAFQVIRKEKDFPNPYLRGISSYYIKIEIPREAPGGTYYIGQKNPGEFMLMTCSSDKAVLYCEDGFIIGKGVVEGEPDYYFEVPETVKNLELFANTSIRVFNSDGREVHEKDAKKYGQMCFPVNQKGGIWRIKKKNPKQTVFVKFKNINNVLSYRHRNRFFMPAKFPALSDCKSVDNQKNKSKSPLVYCQGMFGNAVELSKSVLLELPVGQKLQNGEFDNFPYKQGTIEFFYKPQWFPLEILRNPNQSRSSLVTLFNAGSDMMIYYYTGQRSYMNHLDNDLVFACGASKHGIVHARKYTFGNCVHTYLNKDKWYHIAVTWDLSVLLKDYSKAKYDRNQFSRKTELFNIFIDGKKMIRTGMKAQPVFLHLGKQFAKNYQLNVAPEMIIGPQLVPYEMTNSLACYDEFRVSDIVRYKSSFTVPNQPFKCDEKTKILMHFDGTVEAERNNRNSIQALIKTK